MAAVTRERLEKVALMLWAEVYEASFRGKDRGRFVLSRAQLKTVLGVERLHQGTIQALQDVALETGSGPNRGLVIIDLDDLFPCVELPVMRRYRRPPSELLDRLLRETFPEDVQPDEEEVTEEEDD